MASLFATPSFPPPSDIPASRPTSPMSDRDIHGEPSAGPSAERSTVRLDDIFNFQIVVFQVENTLFQVLKNGFNVLGTPFEGMFALPEAPTDIDNSALEGNSLGNPIHLSGIQADHFRVFLRILYPFIAHSPVVEYDDWVGVLHLATMWYFKEIRSKAITALSDLIKNRPVFERLSLARKYRVPEWLRDGYLELALQRPLKIEELRDPYSPPLPNQEDWEATDKQWEARAKYWEASARNWEAIARISHIQTMAIPAGSVNSYCPACQFYDGPSYPGTNACKCRHLSLVNEVFREELENLKDNPDHVEPRLPVSGSGQESGKKKKKKK